ncbi:MAG: MBL fold metallo-hydrolase [Chloroflexota bacterium]|nr:MBL fold metallo-hydrolase [Chloroflexota bacterium]
MIQPRQRGAALLHDIETTQPATRQVAIWWLGQSGYAIKSASAFLYIDLYLSEHLTTKYADTPKPHTRMTEAPLRGADITNARYVFASHHHSDHLDPGTLPALFTASPQAQLVLPAAHVAHAVSLGLARERLLPVRGDEVLELDGLRIHCLPSAHPGLDHETATGYPFLGFVFEMDGVRLYHSGDTLAYDGLTERLRALQPDIAFLPINGRAGGAGTPPNMDTAEAVTLARAASIPLVIPHHYDMFAFNTADVADFAALSDAAGQPYRVLSCVERYVFQQD